MSIEDQKCVECGIPLQLVGESVVDTQHGKVCKPCYDSGDTGEPYFATFGGGKP